jgi:hypothetical protein
MTTLATLPTELIELICECVANYILEDWEFGDDPSEDFSGRLEKQRFRSRHLASLPLVRSRWAAPGQKALYRSIMLPNAGYYKALQESLTAFPHNGMYVRAILIHWGARDYGGPDGYSYKVLGWFHEMEIQQLIRSCPLLERFHPGQDSPVIGQEGIAALGNIDSIREITWRPTEFQQYGDAVNRAQSSWRHLETIEILGYMRKDDFKYIQPVANRLRTLKIHDHQQDLPSHFESWSLDNIRELDLSTRELLHVADITRIFETCGSNLVALTIPYPAHAQLPILSTIFNRTPRLRHLKIVVRPVMWSEDWSERLQIRNQSTLFREPTFDSWRLESLRSVRFEVHRKSPLTKSLDLAFNSFMRPQAFPNLRKLLTVERDVDGEIQVTNMMNQEIEYTA